MKVGVFGTCRVEDWTFDDVKLIRNKFPRIYKNEKDTFMLPVQQKFYKI